MDDFIYPDCMIATGAEGAAFSCRGYGALLAELDRLRRDFDIEIEVNGVLRRELAEARDCCAIKDNRALRLEAELAEALKALEVPK